MMKLATQGAVALAITCTLSWHGTAANRNTSPPQPRHTGRQDTASIEKTPSKKTLQLLAEARTWLLQAQRTNGHWKLAERNERHRLGIEALAIMALAGGNLSQREAAHRGLTATTSLHARLLADGQRGDPHSYSTTLWLLAALSCDKLMREDSELRKRVAQRLTAKLSASGFESDETCHRALLLIAAARATNGGLETSKAAIEKALRELKARALPSGGMFHAHDFTSPSYGATALACEALLAHAQHAAGECERALSWLRRQSISKVIAKSIVARKSGLPDFAGYLRRASLFEWRAHLASLHSAKAPSSSRLTERARETFAAHRADDGSFRGRYGAVYGTALMILTLAPQ